jgi:xanthine dehydrogenase accessory factor
MPASALTSRHLRHAATQWLAAGQAALVVRVHAIRGSSPREAGVRMLVGVGEYGSEALGTVLGTIGGGHLEWQAIDLARKALAEAQPAQTAPSTHKPLAAWQQTFALGPTLGQCCGGVVELAFEPLTEATLQGWTLPPPRFHLELHGAGHVGQAIVKLLTDIDCTVRWVDERADDAETCGADAPGLPTLQALAALPPHIQFVSTEQAEAEVADAPPSACHLVLTHRHDLDLRIIHAVLQRGDFAFAGLIGSQTKRAKFLHRLQAMGVSNDAIGRLTCPIGLPELPGKEPAVIAVSVVAQLLQRTA